MRGKESRYLKPLLLKVDNLLDHGIPQGLILPPTTNINDFGVVPVTGKVYDEETTAAQQWSQ